MTISIKQIKRRVIAFLLIVGTPVCILVGVNSVQEPIEPVETITDSTRVSSTINPIRFNTNQRSMIISSNCAFKQDAEDVKKAINRAMLLDFNLGHAKGFSSGYFMRVEGFNAEGTPVITMHNPLVLHMMVDNQTGLWMLWILNMLKNETCLLASGNLIQGTDAHIDASGQERVPR